MRQWPTAFIDPTRAQGLRTSGAWGNETIGDYARTVARVDPNRVIQIENNQQYRAAELVALADCLAHYFLQRGLTPGAVISYMLPNWHESCVVSLAAALAGLVLNPLLPIYRERELSFMLNDSHSQLLFIPGQFRNFDYPSLLKRICPELPELQDVVVVRGSAPGFLSFDELPLATPPASLPPVSADAVKLCIYTSGTTGVPKGVLHSHNTIMADVRTLARFWAVGSDDCFFVPSPVTHIGGSLYAHEFVWYSGVPAVLMDIWNGPAAVTAINLHGCTISSGATPFLQELVEACQRTNDKLPSLRLFICGGAAVPPALIRRARALFSRCVACRVYGSTEIPTVTAGALPSDDGETCAETDGAVCGAEVRIVDPVDGHTLPFGAEGELVVRAPEMFLGYANPDDNVAAFTPYGFFKTGDLGRWMDHSHLVITGRKKDIIIRAGENISAKELEDLLGGHPAIKEIAVVGIPHPRTGEAVCACVVLNTSATIDRADISHFMINHGSARQKIPEVLLILDDLPRTATGKVRKEELRTLAVTRFEWSDLAR